MYYRAIIAPNWRRGQPPPPDLAAIQHLLPTAIVPLLIAIWGQQMASRQPPDLDASTARA